MREAGLGVVEGSRLPRPGLSGNEESQSLQLARSSRG